MNRNLHSVPDFIVEMAGVHEHLASTELINGILQPASSTRIGWSRTTQQQTVYRLRMEHRSDALEEGLAVLSPQNDPCSECVGPMTVSTDIGIRHNLLLTDITYVTGTSAFT